MITRTLSVIIFAIALWATCFAQSSYKGLTPGKSTRADVERVLGQPTTQVSERLIEYTKDGQQVYVQYSKTSPTAVRIQVVYSPAVERESKALSAEGLPRVADTSRTNKQGALEEYFGNPRYIVLTYEADSELAVSQVGYYSRELFESLKAESGGNSITNGNSVTYMGLTAGKTTRDDIERVLGPPVRRMSPTLVEYKPRWGADQIHVQYGDGSAEAGVTRLELICSAQGFDTSRCGPWSEAIRQKYRIDMSIPDAYQKIEGKPLKVLSYFGSPLFIVHWTKYDWDGASAWAFYSKELFENVAPKRGCTGTIFGDWETNLGRMTIESVGDPILDDNGSFQQPIKGTYSKNNGTFSGSRGSLWGLGWKDNTGAGTMSIVETLGMDSLTGEWERESGSGPAKGKLVGRCAVATGGNQ
jgi:hypothetical protein